MDPKVLSELNFHHLRYFMAVADHGSISAASRAEGVAQPTVSAQIKQLERDLGCELIRREGRGVALTAAGRMVADHARQIFELGSQLVAAVRGGGADRPQRLVVGVADAIPKLVAWRVLQPALELDPPVQLAIEQDKPERLLAELSQGQVDLVLADAPLGAGNRIQAYSHLLGEGGVVFLAVPELADGLRDGFPDSLDGAPMLMPSDDTTLYHQLVRWFRRHHLEPRVVAEIEDPGLLKTAAQAGVGIAAVPAVIAEDAIEHFDLVEVGPASGMRERVYILSLERRLQHPAVVAISDAARAAFAGTR